MPSVFLSHSSKDKEFVRSLAAFLRQDGQIDVWLDEDKMQAGDYVIDRLQEVVNADVVFVILSPDSVASEWVKREWYTAVHRGKRVVGVRYRDCDIPPFLEITHLEDLRSNHAEGFRRIKAWLLKERPPAPVARSLPQRAALFIGREAELAALRSRLAVEGSVVAVPGLPGLGKTTLALEFAHRHGGDFEAVYWLPCVGGNLASIAGELTFQLGLKLEGDLDRVVHDLKAHCAGRRCLLVLDNVEDEAPGRLVPGGRASVLVTTRREWLDFVGFHKPVKPPLFSVEECLDLFREVLGAPHVDTREAAARALFERLGYVPIALSVAAKLIKFNVRYTIEKFPKFDEVLGLFRDAIAASGENERRLLAAMAVCAPEGFRFELAREVAEIEEEPALDALQELKSRSLVEELDRSALRYRLHALVREAAAPGPELRLKHAAAVNRFFENWETEWRACVAELPEVEVALDTVLRPDVDQETWWLGEELCYAGYALTQRVGRLIEAEALCNRVIHAAEPRADKHALQAAYGNQALILKAWGRLDEALALHEKEEAICEELGNRDGLQRSYGNQALILKAWGRQEEALTLHKKEEAICEELGDRDGLQRSYGNQALILQRRGRLDEAMALHKKEEAICEELGNRDGLQASYGNQAVILQRRGRLDEAMALHKKEEAICEELGNREGLQRSYGNQAVILRAWGRLDEALTLHKKEEAICEELGDRDGLQRSYGNQALTQNWDRLDEAMALLKKKQAICEELGLRGSLAICYENLADLHRARGEHTEALAKARASLAIYTELQMPREIERTTKLLTELESDPHFQL